MAKEDSTRKWMKSYALFTLIVADLIANVGAGVAIGYLAWQKWHAPWWVPLLSSLIGLFSAFYRLIKFSEKAAIEEEKDDEQ